MNKNYFSDKNTCQIYSGDEVIANKIMPCNFTLEELEQKVVNNELAYIFICDYETERKSRLKGISIDEFKLEWNTKYKHNICFDNEANLDDFPNEYCYFVELWESVNGEIILVLYLYH